MTLIENLPFIWTNEKLSHQTGNDKLFKQYQFEQTIRKIFTRVWAQTNKFVEISTKKTDSFITLKSYETVGLFYLAILAKQLHGVNALATYIQVSNIDEGGFAYNKIKCAEIIYINFLKHH